MDSAQQHPPAQFPRRAAVRIPVFLLWVLILGYAGFFSALSLQRHASLNTFAADLSYIDQPMWNTLHGRFLQRTLGDQQVSRVAEHFEPILLPLSFLYVLWDDVRLMLILQTLALALGALPVFWIAASVFGNEEAVRPDDRSRGEWPALAFAAAYLLFPALQAANIADLHADPFVVTPLLFAFWYAMNRRYGPMWAWSLVVMAAKETMPALTAMLGLYVIASAPGLKIALHQKGMFGGRLRAAWRGGVGQGAVLVVVSLAWFSVATFIIVGPLARQVYGTAGPIYLANRYAGFSGGLAGWLSELWNAVREPARLGYLGKLLAPVGWLALLAPEYILLGLPVLAANFLSNYPGQFSGEQHYSAPLVAVMIIAAIYGARRLMVLLQDWIPALRITAETQRAPRMIKDLRVLRASAVQFAVAPHPAWTSALKTTMGDGRWTIAAGLVSAWLLAWALGQQYQNGWTPLARFFQWPQVTAHDRLLDRFVAEIPPGAAVSATPAVHPHLAHRQKIYLFPTIADAEYVLVDVPGNTGMHPADVQSTVQRLISSGQFGIADAADGYLLLKRGAGSAALPDAFYSFARAGGRQPEYPLDVRLGEDLKLVGYDVVDDPRWRETRFRFYWQVVGTLPADTSISFQALAPDGTVADDSALRPMPALLWYPPSRWQPDDIVVIESVPWYLPRAWAPVIAVASGGRIWAPQVEASAGDMRQPVVAADGRLRLPAWGRQDGRLVSYDGPFELVEQATAQFGDGDWQVRLNAWAAPLAAAPGSNLLVSLQWQADALALRDYNVFVHLRDDAGRTIVTGDGPPTWFVPLPTSRWAGETDGNWTAHVLSLPQGLAPGAYDLVVGWYDWQTGVRLPMIGSLGNRTGDEIVLGPVTVASGVGSQPDIPCLMAPASCASQE